MKKKLIPRKHKGKSMKSKVFLNTKKESDAATNFFRAKQSKGYAPEQEKEGKLIRIFYYVPKKDIEELFKN